MNFQEATVNYDSGFSFILQQHFPGFLNILVKSFQINEETNTVI